MAAFLLCIPLGHLALLFMQRGSFTWATVPAMLLGCMFGFGIQTIRWTLGFRTEYIAKFKQQERLGHGPQDPLEPCRVTGFALAKRDYEQEISRS